MSLFISSWETKARVTVVIVCNLVHFKLQCNIQLETERKRIEKPRAYLKMIAFQANIFAN